MIEFLRWLSTIQIARPTPTISFWTKTKLLLYLSTCYRTISQLLQQDVKNVHLREGVSSVVLLKTTGTETLLAWQSGQQLNARYKAEKQQSSKFLVKFFQMFSYHTYPHLCTGSGLTNAMNIQKSSVQSRFAETLTLTLNPNPNPNPKPNHKP